jgi:hypothetical protein
MTLTHDATAMTIRATPAMSNFSRVAGLIVEALLLDAEHYAC